MAWVIVYWPDVVGKTEVVSKASFLHPAETENIARMARSEKMQKNVVCKRFENPVGRLLPAT